MPRSDEERLIAVLEVAEPRLRRRLRELLARVKDRMVLAEVVRALERGRLEPILEPLEAAGAAFAAEVAAVYSQAARAVAEHVTPLVRSTTTFDQTNWRAVDRMRGARLDLIRQVTEDQRNVIRYVLEQGLTAGRNPREMARVIKDSIGLTDYQLRIVDNYRAKLEAGDASALGNTLRDRRYDRTVQRYADERRRLTKAQIDTMTERYRQRWLAKRSEDIALTEAMRATHQGAEDLWRQLIESGQVSADELSREWLTARDERVRGSHRPMHGQKRPFGEAFVSGLGNLLLYPCDPRAPLRDTARCRCLVATTYA